MARSCHHNKSQRKDPFVVLSRIIAGKTKHVKDPFSSLIRAEGSDGAGYRPFNAFWENWGNARTNRNGPKKEGAEKERRRYVNSGLVHPGKPCQFSRSAKRVEIDSHPGQKQAPGADVIYGKNEVILCVKLINHMRSERGLRYHFPLTGDRYCFHSGY